MLRFLVFAFFAPSLAFGQGSPPPHELDHRIELSVDRLTDVDARPAFTEEFILADVALDPTDPRRFYNFSGDLSGRYLEVMSLLPAERRGEIELPALVRKIAAEQRPDGRFGDPDLVFSPAEIGGEHMALLWGNGRLLVGLMTYYQTTGDPVALRAATRLGDFFIATSAQSREPAVAERLKGFGAKGIICFTQYIEGLVMLAGATGEERFVRAATDAYTVLPDRDRVHTHGYLTTLRGVLMLYELTGEVALLDYARNTFDDLLASQDYTRHGAVMEYFGGRGDRDEGCSSADFVRLAFHLAELTNSERYFVVAEYALYNALYYNQYVSGDFGNHQFTEKGMTTVSPQRAWWCCTMHGLRALLDVRDNYLLRAGDGRTELRLLTTHTLRTAGKAYSLRQAGIQGDRIKYRLKIDEWDGSPLTLRTPAATVADWVPVTPAAGDTIDFFVTYRHQFHRAGERTASELPEDPTLGYFTNGPYLLGIRQADFVAEPNWANQISWRDLRPGNEAATLMADYRHGGYPGMQSVVLEPVMSQLYRGHPFLLVDSRFTGAVVPHSSD